MEERRIYKRRRNIERATSFRVDYMCYLRDKNQKESRDFKSIKSLNQWADRNDNENTYGIHILKKLALIDGTWEPFTVIGKKTITLCDLENIVDDLKTSFVGK